MKLSDSPYGVYLNEDVENPKKGHEIFVSKKSNNIDESLKKDLTTNLGIKGINEIKVYSNFLVEGLEDDEFEKTIGNVLAEKPVDDIFTKEDFEQKNKGKKIIVIESKPGQLDMTVDMVNFNNKLITGKDTKNRFKHVIVIDGNISDNDLEKIKKYLINPNEKFESSLEDKKLEREIQNPKNHVILDGFNDLKTDDQFKKYIKENGLPVEFEDIKLVQNYFKNKLKRDPTKVEMLLIGTYWSDHCRHTTFETLIDRLNFSGENQNIVDDIEKFNGIYEAKNKELGKDKRTFMQIAKSSLAFLKNDPEFEGVEFIDYSEEDNAASYKCKIKLENGKKEDWIIMFKNETHNSPTETEPFGGAATALGGSIRDILSGRAVTFAAMRVSGAGDPTAPISETLAGKISQLALSIGSANGASSYGNQIGVAATNVREYFHPNYLAKRFELSYVLGAVKEENLVRVSPEKGDFIIMAGGPTGRDGVGGAVVSSAGAGEYSDEQMGAHVQKGNPLNERTFQRLMAKYPELTKMIKKSNDFGAGGVSVALGELARGVDVYLDEVAKHVKYQGLNDEELTISESQERMAFVISPENKEKFLEILKKENIIAFVAGKITTEKEIPEDSNFSKEELEIFRKLTKKLKTNKDDYKKIKYIEKNKYYYKSIKDIVEDFLEKNENINSNSKFLKLTDPFFGLTEELLKKYLIYLPQEKELETFKVNANKTDKLRFYYKGKETVNLDRSFLDENGVERHHNAEVKMNNVSYFDDIDKEVEKLIEKGKFLEAVKLQLSFIENSSQRALQEQFDSSVNASTILAPYGGKYQDSPQGKKMVNKIPTNGGGYKGIDSKTAIISSHGFNPVLLSQNTYIGGMYSVIEAISSIVATGGEYRKSWLSLQEYFGKLTNDEKYGEVYAGLLGTLKALTNLKVAAIGGKDSMSGSYTAKLEDLVEGKLNDFNDKNILENEEVKNLIKQAKNYLKENNEKQIEKITKQLKEKGVNFNIDVPPSIVAFANCPIDSDKVVSSEFKKAGNKVLHFKLERDKNGLPDFDKINFTYQKIQKLIEDGKVFSSSVIANGGVIEAVAKLSLGNRIGFNFKNISIDDFKPNIGDILIEVDEKTANSYPNFIIGETTEKPELSFGEESLKIPETKKILEGSLAKVWNPEYPEGKVEAIEGYDIRDKSVNDAVRKFKNSTEKLKEQPVAIIPVFPGNNSELDTKHQLEKAGFKVEEYVINTTGTEEEQKQSRLEFAQILKKSDLLVLAGGFSFGDEPGASGKTAVNILKSEELRDIVQEHYNNEDKLTIGTCNGAQMLIKMGIIDDGKIKDELEENDTIIAHNDNLKHIARAVKVKVISILSPFFSQEDLGKEFILNISHGEGNYQITDEKLKEYIKNGQIALQYLDEEGNPTNKYNGSTMGIAGMTDPTGRIFTLMPHTERTGLDVIKNIPGEKELKVMKNAYEYIVGRKMLKKEKNNK